MTPDSSERRSQERWAGRVGDYRVICEIQDAKVTVLVVKIGARREIYR
jgi:mRNA interferase RelE/StbE